MSLHLCHPGFTADAVCCSLSLWTAPDSWEMHISGVPIFVPTPVYLQLSPEVRGSHPHFPMASNGKQKPGPQTLEGKKNKNVTSLLAKKELDIRNYLLPISEIGGRVNYQSDCGGTQEVFEYIQHTLPGFKNSIN